MNGIHDMTQDIGNTEAVGISKELATMRAHFQADPSFAHSWHCNIAMAMLDSFCDDSGMSYGFRHKIANEAATRFMKAAFGVDTSNDMLDEPVKKV